MRILKSLKHLGCIYRDAYIQEDGTPDFTREIEQEDFTNKEEVEAPLYDGCTKYTK